ncbi:hypothetical protein TNIN_83671 [Trichonephila inaurata madagascariensis]|uniref:Uncharacterized protein n=1 Tax=Trichonephila inaurata madagascariensis TaxID=2747483 RepID=A0A8X6XZN5_9ARAC|nr:hypothetical protein TNIN_83671 [Trichonephila inaurata madagascariensis]
MKTRRGRPRILSHREGRSLLKEVKKNARLSAPKLTKFFCNPYCGPKDNAQQSGKIEARQRMGLPTRQKANNARWKGMVSIQGTFWQLRSPPQFPDLNINKINLREE